MRLLTKSKLISYLLLGAILSLVVNSFCVAEDGTSHSLSVTTEFTNYGCGNGIVDHPTEQCDGSDYGTGAETEPNTNSDVSGCTSINDEILNNTPNSGCKLIYTTELRVVKRAEVEGSLYVNDDINTNITNGEDCNLSNIETAINNNKVIVQNSKVLYTFEVFNDSAEPITINRIEDSLIFGAGGFTLPTPVTINARDSYVYPSGADYGEIDIADFTYDANTQGALLNTATVFGQDIYRNTIKGVSSVGICVVGRGEVEIKKLVAKSIVGDFAQRNHDITNCSNVENTSDFYVTRQESVDFRFEVTLKDGNPNPVRYVNLGDNKLGTPVAVTGTGTNNIGDINNNLFLEVNEKWIYEVKNRKLTTGGHSNLVIVEGTSLDGSISESSDKASFCVVGIPNLKVVKKVGLCSGAYCNSVNAGIKIVKLVYQEDLGGSTEVKLDTSSCNASNAYISNNKTVRFTYEVSLPTGMPAVKNVEIDDPVVAGLSRKESSPPSSLTLIYGDDQPYDQLDPGETWVYETGEFYVPAGPHRNDATVKGLTVADNKIVIAKDYAAFCVNSEGPFCGDGVVEGSETCDVAIKGPMTLGLSHDDLNPLNCRRPGASEWIEPQDPSGDYVVVKTECTYCGDGIVNATEECDFAADTTGKCSLDCRLDQCEYVRLRFNDIEISYWKFITGYNSDENDIDYRENLYKSTPFSSGGKEWEVIETCAQNENSRINGFSCSDFPYFVEWKKDIQARNSCVASIVGRSYNSNANLYQTETQDAPDRFNPTVSGHVETFYGATFGKTVYQDLEDDLDYYRLVEEITGFNIYGYLTDTSYSTVNGLPTSRFGSANASYNKALEDGDCYNNYPNTCTRLFSNFINDGFHNRNGDQIGQSAMDLIGSKIGIDGTLHENYTSAFYLDGNCNVIDSYQQGIDPTYDVCGEVNLSAALSPISLIIDKDISSPYVARQFALNPKDTSNWVIWKANGNRPLVVYDPKKSGKIKDGSMLFGNYTFGGRGKSKTPWENGYEALASLDLNKDGFLKGSELKDISLWFDDNSNAISEVSEVVDATKHGLKSLKVSFDLEDEFKDLYSINGFTLETDSKVLSGRTVDWYSGSYVNEGYAQSEISRLSKIAEENLVKSTSSNNKEGDKPFNLGSRKLASKEDLKKVKGLWEWKSAQDKSNKGHLSIFTKGDRIAGLSIIEEKILAPNGEFLTRLSSYPLMGGVQIGDDGNLYLHFMVKAGDLITQSTAKIDIKTGKMLADSVNNFKNQSISYNWTAERIVEP